MAMDSEERGVVRPKGMQRSRVRDSPASGQYTRLLSTPGLLLREVLEAILVKPHIDHITVPEPEGMGEMVHT